ncbi:kinase-like protein [Aspergillus sclerotiicarbonarius CBS 121057]|uniref:non-specific serine/threonine protein kinase n=1 Tax=Aspergillus sclerotiicarbonarius (strain CBS 121057 / IBT 28362) TaxID=1448318 RepID=A0A319DUK4_ASPSB|nr:kinase-like protein [Aspergillus sclerotiicarbonarius CBS 121057]
MRKSFLFLVRPFHPQVLSSRLETTAARASGTLFHRHRFRYAFSTSAIMSQAPGDSTVPHLYVPIEDVEKLERYREGGYHPIAIGDRFHSRYRVGQKLGHGSYSTIWLARDETLGKLVAIKVCTADSDPHELEVLSILSSSRPRSGSSLGETMIPLILDTFRVQGPNGTHACYVTSAARMSLSDAKDGSHIRLFRLEVARALVAQLFHAVEYIHAQGYAHGDLHFGNVLIQLPPGFEQLSNEKLYEMYGEPEFEPIIRFDGRKIPSCVPSRAILPVWLGEASESLILAEAKLLLSDFGEAFSPAKENKFKSHTPLVYRAPESRFEAKPLSFPSDIWSLVCSIWDIIAESPLFEGFLATDDDMICEHVDALGILPPAWWKQWEARQKKFTEDGRPINRTSYRSLEDRFDDSIQHPRHAVGMLSFEPAERDALLSMLRPMLSFRPESRPSAKEVLASEWMVKWALPEYDKAKRS